MFTITDEGSVPSLADLVKHEIGQTATDDALGQLRRRLDDEDLPITPTMGVGDNLRGLVDRIFFRKLLREEPETTCTLPWFDCHVPPGGKTTMRTSTTAAGERSAELKIYGSGIGAGRKVTLAVTSGSEPRAKCATYGFDCRVRPRIYDVRGKQSVELEVIECLGESIVSHDVCPFCGVAPNSVDLFDFRFGQHLDLRSESVGRTDTFELTIEKSFSVSAKLKIPTLAPELTLGAKVSRSMSIEVEQQFPPKTLYRGYTRVGPAPLQTPMWAVEQSVQYAKA